VMLVPGTIIVMKLLSYVKCIKILNNMMKDTIICDIGTIKYDDGTINVMF
jgi:hypothetical protein